MNKPDPLTGNCYGISPHLIYDDTPTRYWRWTRLVSMVVAKHNKYIGPEHLDLGPSHAVIHQMLGMTRDGQMFCENVKEDATREYKSFRRRRGL